MKQVCIMVGAMARTIHVAARMNEAEREKLKQVAEVLDVPESQIIREAVRDKIEDLRQNHPRLQKRDSESQEA